MPEPPADAGLWPAVRYVTGWPETDEDRLAALAQDWRSGGDRFMTAGLTDLSSLGGLWPDPAGEAAGARTQGTLATAVAAADGMTMLANRVDAFAAEVRSCKIDIGGIITGNLPRWIQAGQLPPGIRELDLGLIRDQVVADVDQRIAGCVQRITGLGLLPADLPSPEGGPFPRGGTLTQLSGGGTPTMTETGPIGTTVGGGPLIGLPTLPGAGPAPDPVAGLPGVHIDAAGNAAEPEPQPAPGPAPAPDPAPDPAPAPDDGSIGPFPGRKLPRDGNGIPTPESDYPHTELGVNDGRHGDYPQAREFDGNGQPVKDVDFTDHGRPSQHPNPHEHPYVPNPTGGSPRRGQAQPLAE
ncbi:hypothetical protein AB0M20_34465 [Actinoplanes sp. NPDC051633]|uniref:WXG100-like domain-containing protein n=1 Tax=Actinoplanes sp. NPDC051633 TaxID=3155670 RepID=UPI0034174E15